MFDHFFIIMHERGNISYKQQYKQLICTKDQQNSLIKNQKEKKQRKKAKTPPEDKVFIFSKYVIIKILILHFKKLLRYNDFMISRLDSNLSNF